MTEISSATGEHDHGAMAHEFDLASDRGDLASDRTEAVDAAEPVLPDTGIPRGAEVPAASGDVDGGSADAGAGDADLEAALHAHASAVLDTLAMMAEPATDDPQVNEIIGHLARLPGLAVSDHPDVYDEIQRGLHERLADAEQ